MRTERMTDRLIALVKPSELAQIKARARELNLNTSEYVRRAALGELPPVFDHLADELLASARHAHATADRVLEEIAESEARLEALEARVATQ